MNDDEGCGEGGDGSDEGQRWWMIDFKLLGVGLGQSNIFGHKWLTPSMVKNSMMDCMFSRYIYPANGS